MLRYPATGTLRAIAFPFVATTDSQISSRPINWQLQMLGVIVLSLLVEGAIYAADGEAVRSTLLSEMDLRNIDSYLERQLTEANIPGAALVIVEGDRVTHVRGFGIAGPDSRPVTGETQFYLGSVTKSFTALAVMQLVETGQIELEAPIQNYLPWFRVAHADASSEMKVKHLLNHTSGFSTYAGRTHFTASDISAEAIERRVRTLQTAKLISPVGEGTQYSNANYWVLGAIIESVSGQSYEDYVKERIYKPLDMANSYTSEAAAQQNDLATGYRYWFGRPISAADVPRPRGDLPAMFLISCARDMGNYLLAHMNGGMFGETHVLSESGISRLHTPERKDLIHAMGWVVGSVDNVKTLGHTGTTPTFYVGMAIFPERRRAFALLINAQNQLSGPDVASLVSMVKLNMIGVMAMPISKAPKLHLNLALLGALLVGQVIGLTLSLRHVYRSYRFPHVRPGRRHRINLVRRGLTFVFDVTLVAGMIWWIPQIFEAPLSRILLYAPDAGWLLLLNAALAVTSIVGAVCTAAFLLYQQSRRVKMNSD